ncbi:hypothetical protein KUCAC02_000271, partial [Chaenocephalus aceratus]
KWRSVQPGRRAGGAEIGRRENSAYLWHLSNVGQADSRVGTDPSAFLQSPDFTRLKPQGRATKGWTGG